MAAPDVEVLLPVHNEGEGIESTIRQIYQEHQGRLDAPGEGQPARIADGKR